MHVFFGKWKRERETRRCLQQQHSNNRLPFSHASPNLSTRFRFQTPPWIRSALVEVSSPPKLYGCPTGARRCASRGCRATSRLSVRPLWNRRQPTPSSDRVPVLLLDFFTASPIFPSLQNISHEPFPPSSPTPRFGHSQVCLQRLSRSLIPVDWPSLFIPSAPQIDNTKHYHLSDYGLDIFLL